MKYFIMGAVASAFLTFGIAIIYALTGTLNIAKSLAGGAAGGKRVPDLSGVEPHPGGDRLQDFHGALPPVDSRCLPGSAGPGHRFSFHRFQSGPLCGPSSNRFQFGQGSLVLLHPVLWILAVLTMGVGNISALAQLRVKRLLAYSSIAQMGYLLMTLLAVKQNGASAIMFYLAAYALMDLGAFGMLALLSPPEGGFGLPG